MMSSMWSQGKGRSRGKIFTGAHCYTENLLANIASAHIRSLFSKKHEKKCPESAKLLFIVNFY